MCAEMRGDVHVQVHVVHVASARFTDTHTVGAHCGALDRKAFRVSSAEAVLPESRSAQALEMVQQ